MNTPLVITKGNRQAVIDGRRLSLLKLQNKRKPKGVWPEKEIPDGVQRMNFAFLWILHGTIDDDLVRK